MTEHLSAIPQLHLLGAIEVRTRDSFANWLQVIRSQWLQRRAEILFSVVVTLVLGLAILLVLGLGAYDVLAGAITIGTLVAFYAYTTRIFEPLSTAMDLYARSQRMLASAHRILEVVDQEPTVRDDGEHSIPKERSFDLKLQNVSFGYRENKLVLQSINIEVASGQMVAIVGGSGSGKSTLARLLVRMADPLSGSVILGGRKTSDYTLEALRQHICYVPQYPVLFRGTIRDNLLYAKPSATPAELEEAMQAASLEPVLHRLPKGIDHRLESAGSGLSGGEQQRLAIARALLRYSPVLILDEATSALDVPTEASVLTEIRRLHPHTSFLVISHRVSSLRSVDRVIVIDDGKIVAQGSFAALQRSNSQFRAMLEIRLDDTSPGLVDRVSAYCEG